MAVEFTRRVLVISKDIAAGQQMGSYLAANGFGGEVCASVGALLANISKTQPCLVFIEWETGTTRQAMEVVYAIRAVSLIPCMLRASVQTNASERIYGLEHGVDDWIPAGTNAREVLARIRAVLRRSAPCAVYRLQADHNHLRLTGPPQPWRLSEDRRELYTPDGSACGLTAAEFDLMYALALDQRAAVPRETLSQAVFRRAWYPDDRSIDNLVFRLKRKLAVNGLPGDPIKPVRGIGYVFMGFYGTSE